MQIWAENKVKYGFKVCLMRFFTIKFYQKFIVLIFEKPDFQFFLIKMLLSNCYFHHTFPLPKNHLSVSCQQAMYL